MSKPIAVGEADFQAKVLHAEVPVLVDFWAEWCGPCKAVAPELEALGEELGNQLLIAKVDIESNSDLTAQYGIRNIPTLLLFKNGEIVDSQIGMATKDELAALVQPHLY